MDDHGDQEDCGQSHNYEATSVEEGLELADPEAGPDEHSESGNAYHIKTQRASSP
jgi:hypothetical protein